MFPLLTGAVATLFVIAGAWCVLWQQVHRNHRVQSRMMGVFALGTGLFLGAVFLDFLPDALEGSHSTFGWMMMLTGVLALWTLSFAVDIAFHRDAARTDPLHTDSDSNPDETGYGIIPLSRGFSVILMASMTLHTFFEGVSISVASDHVDLSAVSFAVATVAHKLPEGFLWAISLLPFTTHATSQKLLWLLSIPAVGTLAGSAIGLFTGPGIPVGWQMTIKGLLAGALLYICMTELLPALQDQRGRQRVWFLVGASAMMCTAFLK